MGVGATLEQRAARKRQLMEELTVVRQQKADVLRQIQQIAKKQRTTGIPPPKPGDPLTRRQAIDVEHHRRQEALWQTCLRIIQELLKNTNIKLYFGEPVRRDYAPNYYDVIKNPMDLGTIKRECVFGAVRVCEPIGWWAPALASAGLLGWETRVERGRPTGRLLARGAALPWLATFVRADAALFCCAPNPTRTRPRRALATCAGKLEPPNRKYSDVYGFLADVRLTFQNCRTFNPVRSGGSRGRTAAEQAQQQGWRPALGIAVQQLQAPACCWWERMCV